MPEPEQTVIVVDPPAFEIDPPAFTMHVPASGPPPTPAEIEAMKQYFMMQRDLMRTRIEEIEALLGFVATNEELAVRVAKIELFLGI